MKNHTLTVDAALAALRRAIDDDAREHIANGLFSYLKRKPMVANTIIEGCTFTANEDSLHVRPRGKNGAAVEIPARKKRRMSPAGRARIAAAARKRWREYNKKKGAKK